MDVYKKLIAVIGGHEVDEKIADLAYRVGKIIAQNNCVLICGGKGGVMKEAARGAKEENGLTVGILPGAEKTEANEFIDIAIPTNISSARNAIIARACDLAIAIDGSYGTLSEIALCLTIGKKVLGLHTHNVKGIIKINDLKVINKYLRNNIT